MRHICKDWQKFSNKTKKDIEEYIEKEVNRRILEKTSTLETDRLHISIPVKPRPFSVGSYHKAKAIFDKAFVSEALNRNGGVISRASESIGLNRNTIARYKRY